MTDIDHKMEDGGAGDLYFYLQRYKKELRLQFLQDIHRMKEEGVDQDAMIERLVKHERSVKAMRYAFDLVAGNPNPTFSMLLGECDRHGLNEFRDRLLFTRTNGGRPSDEQIAAWHTEDWQMHALEEKERNEVRAAFEVIKANSRLPVNESGTDGMKGLNWLQIGALYQLIDDDPNLVYRWLPEREAFAFRDRELNDGEPWIKWGPPLTDEEIKARLEKESP